MQRRKFVVGLGSLAAGGAAATGTGAFTSVEAERRTKVNIVGDKSAYLGFEPGDTAGVSPYVDIKNGELVIKLDANGEGSGVNTNAVTEIGDTDEPETEYAFKITNQGTQPVSIFTNYEFNDGSWINYQGYNANDQSFIELEVFGEAGPSGSPITAGGAQSNRSPEFPSQTGSGGNATNAWESKGGPWITEETQIYGGNRFYELPVGESWYFVIRVDTTGEDAKKSDNLSGSLKIRADDADDNQK
ncbi:hypothetical protein EKH57_09005 [Halorubrum sp. BOL3-1]|uniref:hypothetical protein n=1 Tax=Halorubrum sp. BOL3-1 TaxID=2497325 RepID=UPI00100514BA|nr:hypothetical protein [Halorubrum sp. BOL3-1]QAU12851.1 hypothetical protein EKH57_09005 [Halorubrum sp. BOL3-1]